jgi:hypothetical protein
MGRFLVNRYCTRVAGEKITSVYIDVPITTEYLLNANEGYARNFQEARKHWRSKKTLWQISYTQSKEILTLSNT